jgi:hypothetical protein
MGFEADAGAQLKARLAGVFYLGTIAAGIFAEVGARGRIRADSDVATAANIAAHTGLYRLGEAADVVMLCCYIVVTALLYELFGRTQRTLSLVAAGFSLTGIAVLAADGIFHLAPLALLQSGLPAPERDTLIGLSLSLHGDLYGVSLIFFGVYCVLLGVLAIRTRLVPVAVGALLILGGASHLLTKTAGIVSPELAASLPRLMNLAPLIGEAALAIWLLAFGGRRKPSASASPEYPAPGRW